MPLFAILGADTKEFTKRKDRCSTKSSVLFAGERDKSDYIRGPLGFLSL